MPPIAVCETRVGLHRKAFTLLGSEAAGRAGVGQFGLLWYHVMIHVADDQKLPGTFAALIFQQRRVPKGFPTDVAKVARRKLVQLNNATMLGDLVAPPGNRLEALRGDLAGKHSIRINDQWRIVFLWSDQGPEEVEIVDYH